MIYIQRHFYWIIYLGVELINHVNGLRPFSFILFHDTGPTVIPILISTTKHEKSSCSTSSPIFVIVSLCKFSHSSKYVVITNVDFVLNFPEDLSD